MSLWTKSELENLFICSLPHDFECSGVSIDTRTLKSGDIFIAISGDVYDGHAFAKAAEEKGAAAIISTIPLPEISCPVIQVDHALGALQALGRTARERTKASVIAITGSVGKTSTKDILYKVLSQFGSTTCAPASYNNHWGVPLTLSRLPRDANYAILEIGMNQIGEIAPLSEMVRPHIAIITAIAPAHIGNMGSLEAIAREKAEIFVGLEKDGVAIIPTNSPFHDQLKAAALKKFPRYIFSFGEEARADVRLEDYGQNKDDSAKGRVIIGDQNIAFCLPLVGRHMAVNSLCAFAVGRALRLDLPKIGKALQTIGPLKNRCQIHHLTLPGDSGKIPIILVDDSFNANVASMKAGLDVLTSIQPKGEGRRIAVLGEMLELGSFAIEHHQEISDYCATHPIDFVFLCGGSPIKQAFSGSTNADHVENCKELIPLVMAVLQPNDVVLVKGSKGSRVIQVAEALIAAATEDKSKSMKVSSKNAL